MNKVSVLEGADGSPPLRLTQNPSDTNNFD